LSQPADVLVLPGTVEEGQARSFAFRDQYGLLAEGFVIRRGGKLYAYRNQCRHQPLTLDYGDGEFFTEDNAYLLCRNHGALFQPETGLCIAGPCTGASLFPMVVREIEARVEVLLPDPADEVELE
jgi:nitrite reductase/ring-hydroxylating ferredoxin subunit